MAGQKKKYVHVAIVGGLALYLGLFRIVYSTFFVHNGKPIPSSRSIPSRCQLRYGIDMLDPTTYEGELVYELQGWAFVHTIEASPGDFQKSVIFDGPGSQVYELPAQTRVRRDVTEVFDDLDRDFDESGFRVVLSPFALPVGRYRLGILYSDSALGTFSCLTGKYILRTPNTLQLHDLREGRPSFLASELPEQSELYYGVDQLSAIGDDDGGVFVLDGWSFFPGSLTPPDRSLRQVVLLSEAALPYLLDLETRERPDVTQAFHYLDRELDQSGFRAYISQAHIRSEVYRIGVLHTESGGIRAFGLTDWCLRRTDSGVELIRPPCEDAAPQGSSTATLQTTAWRGALALDPSGNLLMRLLGQGED
jgi:hypothetical protein